MGKNVIRGSILKNFVSNTHTKAKNQTKKHNSIYQMVKKCLHTTAAVVPDQASSSWVTWKHSKRHHAQTYGSGSQHKGSWDVGCVRCVHLGLSSAGLNSLCSPSISHKWNYTQQTQNFHYVQIVPNISTPLEIIHTSKEAFKAEPDCTLLQGKVPGSFPSWYHNLKHALPLLARAIHPTLGNSYSASKVT